MKAKLAAAMVLGAVVCMPALAQESPHSFSGTLGLFSDYRFRGVSQTDRDPAIQLTLEYGHESGFYAGLFGSNVDFADDSGADIEVDLYLGFGIDVSEGVNLDVSLTRYMYPGTRSGVDFDYNELIGKLTFADQYHVELGYSNDVFASGESGLYVGVGGAWELGYELELVAGLGYYNLDREVGRNYLDWNLGLARTFNDAITVSLVYHDTNSAGEENFGDFAKGRLVLGVELNF